MPSVLMLFCGTKSRRPRTTAGNPGCSVTCDFKTEHVQNAREKKTQRVTAWKKATKSPRVKRGRDEDDLGGRRGDGHRHLLLHADGDAGMGTTSRAADVASNGGRGHHCRRRKVGLEQEKKMIKARSMIRSKCYTLLNRKKKAAYRLAKGTNQPER